MYASPDETLAALERVGYFTDRKTATTVYLAGELHRPILLEGPAGAGKTELAASVSRAYGVPILRLQCYQGINEEKAIGQYDKSLQELHVLLMSKSDHTPDWAEIKREITSRAYFMAGPLLEAIERDQPCVLLIDEIDKVDYAFEAMLLELLSVWTLSIPRMGTVQATSIPYVFLTSNQERRLGDPLRRRSFYLVVEHPAAEREAAIVARRAPEAMNFAGRCVWLWLHIIAAQGGSPDRGCASEIRMSCLTSRRSEDDMRSNCTIKQTGIFQRPGRTMKWIQSG